MENIYGKQHEELVRKISPECMVLLKSDGSFPLKEAGKLALFGPGARNTIKGGTGSGDVNVYHYPNVEEGLKNAGFTISSTAWLDAYDKAKQDAIDKQKNELRQAIIERGPAALFEAMGAVVPEPKYDFALDGEGEACIYVLARNSGEGADRTVTKGDFLLSDSETRDILALAKKHAKFLLVLNVGGPVDLSPVLADVPNILLLSQLGSAIGDAFADVLLGKAYPSGKLTTSWARFEDYPNVGNFGDQDDTYYKEGIFVGYRWFDATGKEPLFPFGFGLGYTEFAIDPGMVTADKSTISVTVRVTNLGQTAGKETVQLYVSIPEGKLVQPVKTLAAFKKTSELVPGQEEELVLSFRMEEIASFDEESKCQILEKGDYHLFVGKSSADFAFCGIVTLDGDAVVDKLHDVGGTPDFEDWKPEKRERVLPRIMVSQVTVKASDMELFLPAKVELDPEIAAIVKEIPDAELANLCLGKYQEISTTGMIGNASFKVAGAAGEITDQFASKGIPGAVMADGPAGIRISTAYAEDENGIWTVSKEGLDELFALMPPEMAEATGFGPKNVGRVGEVHYHYATAIPIGTALAQSFSEEVQELCGDIVGKEMERFGVHLWLAPALNIHRSVLCGRNFEYYSEDPLIAGKTTAAITRGVQKHPGRGVTIKHFCCNNQETNRTHSNSHVSQRALRDIYLKGFRIAVLESAPMTIMTSYNLLNGEHTSQRPDLLETLLRGEWGYQGTVMSDWVLESFDQGKPAQKYPLAVAHASILAGNDIMMPGDNSDHENVMASLADKTEKYHLTREQLERSAVRVAMTARKLAGK